MANATAATTRTQVCMSFSPKEDKALTKKYKAYVLKCKGRILAKAAWAKMVLLNT
tara:strand:+ start:1337 stop:1501 length:165 start_codon:yes stop_codon:yes gene_type:complete